MRVFSIYARSLLTFRWVVFWFWKTRCGCRKNCTISRWCPGADQIAGSGTSFFHGFFAVSSPVQTAPELYLTEPSADCAVSLSRMGTRVLANLTELDEFQRELAEAGLMVKKDGKAWVVHYSQKGKNPMTVRGCIAVIIFHNNRRLDLCRDLKSGLVHN